MFIFHQLNFKLNTALTQRSQSKYCTPLARIEFGGLSTCDKAQEHVCCKGREQMTLQKISQHKRGRAVNIGNTKTLT